MDVKRSRIPILCSNGGRSTEERARARAETLSLLKVHRVREEYMSLAALPGPPRNIRNINISNNDNNNNNKMSTRTRQSLERHVQRNNHHVDVEMNDINFNYDAVKKKSSVPRVSDATTVASSAGGGGGNVSGSGSKRRPPSSSSSYLPRKSRRSATVTISFDFLCTQCCFISIYFNLCFILF